MISKATLGLGTSLQFGAVAPGGGDGWGALLQAAPPPDQAAPHEQQGGFSKLYAFGDSLSDVGNDYTATGGVLPTGFIYSDGRFSNGRVWVQDLSQQLGLGAVKASLLGGRDFAYGGAETGNETLHTVNPLDLPSQLAQFVVDDPHPAANALYTLSIGANDVIDAISAYAGNPGNATADVQQAVNNEANFLGSLAALGAKNFLLLNVPDLGKTPEESGSAATATQLASLYNSELTTALQALVAQDHLSIHVADTFTLLDEAVADPGAFGLKNVTTPVWTGDFENPLSGTLNAHGRAQNSYLFFDHLHPTATGHAAIADLAHAALAHVI